MAGNFPALLERFRATHRPLTASHNGRHWSYFAGGSGEPLLLLEGGMGNGESYFEYVLSLEDRFRVIAPGIQVSVRKLDQVLDGLAAVLDAEALPAVHLFGHSQGGCVAHAFARKYPGRVKSMILSSTGLPQPQRAARIAWQTRLVKFFPERLLRAILVKQMGKIMQANAPEMSAADRAFWANYAAEPSAGLKGRALSSAAVQLDYHRNWRFSGTWTGRVLILHCDGDTLIPARLFDDLCAVFPAARAHVFHGAGHLGLISRAPEYLQAIRQFLDAAA